MNKQDQIDKFTKILFKIGKDDLTNFKKNIKTLIIEESDFQNRPIDNAGSYNEKENKIYLRDLFSHDIIYHELFHLASTRIVDNITYSGISISSLDYKHNIGLNEGYTQLLTDRYFPSEVSYTLSYPYEVVMAHQIETIIGEEEMLSLYLTADFKSFVLRLEKYLNLGEIKKLINNIDFIHDNLYKNKNVVLLKEKLQEVSQILLKAYQTKLELSETSNKEDKLKNFVINMDLSMEINNEEYDFYIPNKEPTPKGGQK